MRAYATEENPEIVEVKQQLAEMQDQLAKLTGVSQDTSSDLVLPKGKVPEASLEYLRKIRDVKFYETISELIAKQFEMAKLDEARQGSIIQVVDPAIPPDHRSFPKRTISVILAMLLSFFRRVWMVADFSWFAPSEPRSGYTPASGCLASRLPEIEVHRERRPCFGSATHVLDWGSDLYPHEKISLKLC